MADPMLTTLESEAGPALITKVNENFRRRWCVDVRTVADADATQTSTDELLNGSAVAASRTLALLPVASANSLFLVVTAATGTETYTINPDASEQIDGAATKVITAAGKFLLIPNGSAWTCMTLT